MSLKDALGPQLPYLRRYARALTGSQALGDAAVLQMLELLLATPNEFDADEPTRPELYRTFHKLWQGMSSVSREGGPVASLSMHTRQSLLLTTIEGFSVRETARILGSTPDDVISEIASARQAIAESLQPMLWISRINRLLPCTSPRLARAWVTV